MKSWGGDKKATYLPPCVSDLLGCCYSVVTLHVWLIKCLWDVFSLPQAVFLSSRSLLRSIPPLLCRLFLQLLLAISVNLPRSDLISFSPSSSPFFSLPSRSCIMGWAAEFDQQFFKGHITKRKLSAKGSRKLGREGKDWGREEGCERDNGQEGKGRRDCKGNAALREDG